jgi:two-component system, chemotaxis family, chemotaxis protein CheY
MKRVLVIEDDATLGWLLEKILVKKYSANTVSNGQEAWSWMLNGNIPDLIISNIKLPHLDGIELLKNLRASRLFRNIPVIVISGIDDHSMKEKCRAYGALTYLVKPFQPQRLLSEVEHLVAPKVYV